MKKCSGAVVRFTSMPTDPNPAHDNESVFAVLDIYWRFYQQPTTPAII
jgi:hypothetical protein